MLFLQLIKNQLVKRFNDENVSVWCEEYKEEPNYILVKACVKGFVVTVMVYDDARRSEDSISSIMIAELEEALEL